MRYVAAYLLAALGTKGGKEPTAADVEKILSSVGIEADGARVKQIIAEMHGKDIQGLIAEGSKKLASVPAGGAAPAATAAAAAPAAAGAAPAAAKKEEAKKKEESEESDDDMGFGLFD